MKRLEKVRARGWAEDDGEFDIVSNCVAAPVWDHADRVAGAISITTFREKTGLEELRRSVPDLLATTMSISLELGWKPKGETAPSWAKATG